ncbi:macrophage mannose receptor 1 [Astyanax mexicanus]|uniref:macrophage mannose receptor 1 n=1 Tax=Astyanax mexicanus TaxID=7994 RepID=UPI0020CAF040|nr:macrophage mannose receptor 1 [Astyanax mexicanus]
MTQSEARAACRENYTDLVTVCSEEENAALINLINSTVWIGLQRSQFSSKWSNGDEVTFSALTGSCGPKPCCAAMKTDASWDNITCTEKRNFMCYKQDQTDLTFSYHLITENKTWYEAQSYCRKNYTDLVSIRDQEQNEAVKIAGMKSSDFFWIGLLRDDWEWADGGRSAYRNWDTIYPRTPSTPTNCTQLNNGKWQNVYCSNSAPAVLCYNTSVNVGDDQMTGMSSTLNYCKKVFSAAEQRNSLTTFHLIEKNLTQSEARAACRENYTDLVTVYNDEDITALIRLTGIGSAWTGLYRNVKWSNGDDVTFSAATGDCDSWRCCAAMRADGLWENLQCTETRNLMCYKQDQTDLTFSYHLITDQFLTWYEAQSYCRKNYTDLVSIRDQEQNEAVKIAGMNSSDFFWIGLLRDDWQWADGGRSAYRNWWDDHPKSSPADCVKLVSGKMYSVPCSNTGSALCYSMHIHVSDDTMSWENALDYCKKDNRDGLLRIESDLEQEQLESELRRRGVSGPMWVGLGQKRITELLKLDCRLSLGPWTKWSGERPPPSSCGAPNPVEKSCSVKTSVSKLRAVCRLKQT